MRFLTITGSALLADEMGCGKSATTIAAIEQGNDYPALIVCPNTVKSVWEREFALWAPHRRVNVAGQGTASATAQAEAVLNGGADVLVLNWDALRNLSRLAPFGSVRLEACSNCDPNSTRRPAQCERENKLLNLIPWRAVVADEAHRAKDPKSRQTRALWAVGDAAPRRIALTGTPVANSAEDLWSIMRFVSPREYPNKIPWLKRYAHQVPNPYSQMAMTTVGFREDTREELDRYLLPRFIRRTKAQVLPDLPPKTYERRDVILGAKERRAYKALKDNFIAEIDGGVLATTSVLTNALRLRQLASAFGVFEVDAKDRAHEMTFDDIGREFDKVDARVRLSEPSSKLDALEEVLEELGDRQAVIFADSRQLIDLAFARLASRYTCAKITGPVGTAERAVAVENFQAGHARLMFATVGAGGEGITLTAADTAIFLQRPWSQVLNKQAEDRLHRIGQTAQNVTYIDLVAVDTIEDRVFEVLQSKADSLEELVRDEETLRRWLT